MWVRNHPKVFMSKKKSLILPAFLLIVISFSFITLVIRDFTQPLAGHGDTNVWEYIGFYVSKNLSFEPFPQLNFVNNQVFYPYGVNSIFQNWGFERDFFYAILLNLFGHGPWLQIYYLLSILITAIGTCILLFRDYGLYRSSGAGFIVTFFNFYAIYKYPYHYGLSILHWTTLSLVVDFLIIKKAVLKKHIPLNLALMRVCLLMLSLGQELGYVAGFALTSLTISSIFVTGFYIYRYKNNKFQILQTLEKKIRIYQKEFFESSSIHIALLSVSVLFGYLYIPLVLQIAREAKQFSEVAGGGWWVHPLRLLIPSLPGFNPLYGIYGNPVYFQLIFGDTTEGINDGSPGWFLVTIGLIGLWQSRKRIIIFVPLLVILLMCLFYNPVDFPILRIFPWFTFNRVGGRCTLIYTVILCLFALEIDFSKVSPYKRQLLSLILVCLACAELCMVYLHKSIYTPYSFDKNFFPYMEYVKQQPGEAVLDWPFCIIGGNGIGAAQGLCPYYNPTHGTYSLRRFHNKKVMGQYFGRLHPSQIESNIEAGWPKLFSPDSPDIFKAKQENKCFNLNEWSFFTDFYKFNDFAGINLYVDLLPAKCVQEFYSRFGDPAIETTVPGGGVVKFIPKSLELRKQVNLKQGAKLKFEPFLNTSESDLLSVISPNSIEITGLSHIEINPQGIPFRWALGPETQLIFKLPESQILELSFRFHNPIDSQDVLIELNDSPLKNFVDVKNNTEVEGNIKIHAVKGFNNIVFKYKDWNTNQSLFAPQDNRAMAVFFEQLVIQPIN